ncbi:M28 family peptidase [Daejeonella oryzae]|uniref:M28 family peptidase n=1 Tax=Daejeonella oryzae TaxID=1122943 RepID=UPI00056BED58|nr:M28 family peptidase [Daejeonella oryzae]
MKKQFLWILALWISIPAFAQDPRAQKFAKQITAKDAKKHLSILASDEYEGRETGKPGAEKAANYIAAQFKKLGLTAPVNGSYFQNVSLVENLFEVKSFNINGTALTFGKDFYFSGTPDTKAINASEVVFIGYGIDSENYSDLKNTDINGKVVLFINKGEPVKNGISAVTKSADNSDWSKGRKRLQYIQSKNPSLILAASPDVAEILEKNGEYFKSAGGRLSLKKEKAPDAKANAAAVVNIPVSVADMILKNSGLNYETLKSSIDNSSEPKTQTVKTNFSTAFGQLSKDVKAMNVMGFLPGTDLKDEVLVFSAHYDHIGLTKSGTDKVNNGADDDGSGTTGVIEIARAFAKAKKAGKGPRRSILFLAVTGEEKGLLGSEWYSENPVFPLNKTIADLNIDMIGRIGTAYKGKADSANYCYLIGSDKLSSDLHKISENANSIYTKMTIDYKFNDPKDPERIYYRSDHYNFAKHGIPIIFYFNGVHEDYHKPSDEVHKINFPLLAKRAQLVYYTGWDLANRESRPAVDVKNDMPATR